jgi:septation ring formation regulator EzrA
MMNKEDRIYLHCPLCEGGNRRKSSDIVCPRCYQKYTNEASIALAKGNYISLWQWTKEKAAEALPELEKECAQAKAEVDQLRAKVHEETLRALKKTLQGKPVFKEIWNQAYQLKKQELWKQHEGNKAFARMKALEARISFIQEILAKTEPEKKEVGAKVIALAPKN